MAFKENSSQLKSIILSAQSSEIFGLLQEQVTSDGIALLRDLLFKDEENAGFWSKLLGVQQAEMQLLLKQVTLDFIENEVNLHEQVLRVIEILKTEGAVPLMALLLQYPEILVYPRIAGKPESSLIGQAIVEGPNSFIFQQLIPQYWEHIPAKYQALLEKLYPMEGAILGLEKDRGFELIEKILQQEGDGLSQFLAQYRSDLIASLAHKPAILRLFLQLSIIHEEGNESILEFLLELYPEFLERAEFFDFVEKMLKQTQAPLGCLIWVLNHAKAINSIQQAEITQLIERWLDAKGIQLFVKEISEETNLAQLHVVFKTIWAKLNERISQQDLSYMLQYQPTQAALMQKWFAIIKDQNSLNLKVGLGLLDIFFGLCPESLRTDGFIERVIQHKNLQVINSLLSKQESQSFLSEQNQYALTQEKERLENEGQALPSPILVESDDKDELFFILDSGVVSNDSPAIPAEVAASDSGASTSSGFCGPIFLESSPTELSGSLEAGATVDSIANKAGGAVSDTSQKSRLKVRFQEQAFVKNFDKFLPTISIAPKTIAQELVCFWNMSAKASARDWDQLWIEQFAGEFKEKGGHALMPTVSASEDIIAPEQIHELLQAIASNRTDSLQADSPAAVASEQAFSILLYPVEIGAGDYGLLMLFVSLDEQLAGVVYFKSSEDEQVPNLSRLLSRLVPLLDIDTLFICSMDRKNGYSAAYITAVLEVLAHDISSSYLSMFNFRKTRQQFLEIQRAMQQQKVSLLNIMAEQELPNGLNLVQDFKFLLLNVPEMKVLAQLQEEMDAFKENTVSLVKNAFPNIAERSLQQEELECIYKTLGATLGEHHFNYSLSQEAFSIWDESINIGQESGQQQVYPMICSCIHTLLTELHLPTESKISELSIEQQHALTVQFIQHNSKVLSSIYSNIIMSAQDLREKLKDRLALNAPLLSALQEESELLELATPFLVQLVAQAGVAQEMAAESNTSLKSILKFK